MNDNIFQGIRKDMTSVNDSISQAQDLISALKSAGEDTSALEIKLRELVKKKNKWDKVLAERGV